MSFLIWILLSLTLPTWPSSSYAKVIFSPAILSAAGSVFKPIWIECSYFSRLSISIPLLIVFKLPWISPEIHGLNTRAWLLTTCTLSNFKPRASELIVLFSPTPTSTSWIVALVFSSNESVSLFQKISLNLSKLLLNLFGVSESALLKILILP